jgi:hypothetical protein
MLNSEARNMNALLQLTFTIPDETNHEIVTKNHASCLSMYGLRASYTLDYVRAALSELEKQ